MPQIQSFDPLLGSIAGVPDLSTLSDLPEDPNILENEDGSADILDLDDTSGLETVGFFENLAESVIDDQELDEIASDLLEKLENDGESRKKRIEQYEEGIRRTGLGEDAPGGAQFQGASKVVHPILAEACVDFSARAIKELFPHNGPVKAAVIGAYNKGSLDRAEVKVRGMNWQLTKGIPEYRDELEQLLTQTPMGGSQYQKFWVEDGCIRTEFVPVDNVLLPFAAGSFYRAQRVTHVQDITQQTFDDRVRSGLYRDIDDLGEPGDMPEETKAQKATDKVEGRTSGDAYNTDGLRRVFEVYTWLSLDNDGETDRSAPYIVTIDEYSEVVLSIYRNWEEGDAKCKKLDWMVEYKFIPWRGAYGIGLPHLIGGIAAALTGALRALLDSAHINNAATMLKLKGGRVTGQSTSVEVTQIQEIEAPAGVDDIKKIAMPMPFNPPSPVLFQLLGFLETAGKNVIATSEELMSQVGDRTPVGTTMALIEQGSSTYAAIHSRLHHSQAKALEIISRLNRTFPEVLEEINEATGDSLTPEDFSVTSDIEPVSDPNIFSESQRYAQFQAVMQMTQDPNVKWDKNALYQIGMKLLKFPFGKEVLPPIPEAHEADPVDENVFATKGLAIKAFMEQDHIAHLTSHLLFCTSPIYGANPLMSVPTVPLLLDHCKEHLAMFYSLHAKAAMGAMGEMSQMTGGDPDAVAHQGLALADQEIAKHLTPIMPMLQQAMQIATASAPKPPLDPSSQAAIQIGMAEIQRKTQMDQATLQADQAKMQGDMQYDQAKLQAEQQREDARLQIEQMKQQAETAIAQMKLEGEQRREEMAAHIELMKGENKNREHQITELMKNTQDNLANIIVEKLKLGQQASLMQEQPESNAVNTNDAQLAETLTSK